MTRLELSLCVLPGAAAVLELGMAAVDVLLAVLLAGVMLESSTTTVDMLVMSPGVFLLVDEELELEVEMEEEVEIDLEVVAEAKGRELSDELDELEVEVAAEVELEEVAEALAGEL